MVANISGIPILGARKHLPKLMRSVGHAERTIRLVKEAFRVQLLEFEKMGYTPQFEKKVVQARVKLCVFLTQLFFSGAGFQENPKGDCDRVSDSSSQFCGFWVESVGGVTPKFD